MANRPSRLGGTVDGWLIIRWTDLRTCDDDLVKLDHAEAWGLLTGSPSAVLGTVDPDHGSNLVPVVFTPVSQERIVISVDEKPKRTRRLRRLANIESDPRVSLLADHYDDDWSRLWWVRADGRARVVDSVEPSVEDAHRRRHPQTTDHELGPWIDIAIHRLTAWSAT